MRARASIVAFLWSLLLTGPAPAATITGNDETVTYRAAPGEQNALTFEFPGVPEGLTVRDSGATIVASGQCRSRDAHTAVCPLPFRLDVVLADGDDSMTDPEAIEVASVRGGEGDDTLRSSLLGALYGGPGDDVLTSDGTDDLLLIGGPGADTFSGGTVSYASERSGVRVTLDGVANDGLRGERDNVRRTVRFLGGSRGPDLLVGNNGSQWLYGGRGNDRLIGRGARDVVFGDAGDDVSIGGPGNDEFRDFSGDDRLLGGPGNDVLNANAGADVLVGGIGNDRLRGGEGRDTLFARDGMRDRVSGGDGFDRARIDRLDRVGTVEIAHVRTPRFSSSGP